MFEAIGYKNVKTYVNTSFPGNANHEMGRHGWERSKNICSKRFNQMHEVEKCFYHRRFTNGILGVRKSVADLYGANSKSLRLCG
jgi:hypothetical protein